MQMMVGWSGVDDADDDRAWQCSMMTGLVIVVVTMLMMVGVVW